MNFKKITWILVGPDLSGAPPIYRPSYPLVYPDEKLKNHYRVRQGSRGGRVGALVVALKALTQLSTDVS